MKQQEVLVNLYRLKVGPQQLYQYDVSFQRARSKSESSAPDQADAGVKFFQILPRETLRLAVKAACGLGNLSS